MKLIPLWDGTRGMLLERIMGENGLELTDGAFCFDTSPERLSEAVFQIGQALTRVYDLTLLSRSNLGSTFYDDLADVLFRLVDETKIQRDFKPEVPNAEVYPVDYRIEGKGEAPLFYTAYLTVIKRGLQRSCYPTSIGMR